MEQLILAILREKDKLKLSTLYQILIGKRTSSTICYAFFHDLLAYFGCLTQLEEESLYHTCQKLAKRGKVALEDGHISLTGQMNENRADFVLPGHINFYRFGKVDGVGWGLVASSRCRLALDAVFCATGDKEGGAPVTRERLIL